MDDLFTLYDGTSNVDSFKFSKAQFSSWEAPVCGVILYFTMIKACRKVGRYKSFYHHLFYFINQVN